MARESDYQAKLIKRLEEAFPGCLVLKNDEQYIAGIPDLTILYHDRYAVLEVKRSKAEMERPGPNQDFYISMIASMGGTAGFVYPENELEVFHALQHAFESDR